MGTRGTSKERVECHECGQRYKSIGLHWSKNDCERPSLSEKQREIIIGNLLGDGHITNDCKRYEDRHSAFVVTSIQKEYLEHLMDEFGVFSNSIKVSHTAEETAENLQKTGFSPNATPENCETCYQLHSRYLPTFTKLRNRFYNDGEKRFPTDLDLSPIIVRYWFAGDGTIYAPADQGDPKILIYCYAEEGREKYLKSLFREIGFDPRVSSGSIRFDATQTEKLFDYMGREPVPGYEYKWDLVSGQV